MIESILKLMLFFKKYGSIGYGDSFFRYRKVTEYTLKALKDNELWGTLASSMQDKNDCSVSLKKNKNKN